MKKKEIQVEVSNMLAHGQSKSNVFAQYSGKGVSDRVLANMIASHPSPELCSKHAKLIDAMIVLAWLQLVLAVLVSLVLGLKHGLVPTLLITAFIGGFAYLFVWGFTNDKAWAYNATIFLSIINLPKSFNGFAESPVISLMGLLLSVGLVAFTWYVRSKIFPDFAFISPKKIKGKFEFST